MADTKTVFDRLISTIQVLGVVSGVVVSVLSFNATRQKEAEARVAEAAKPFYTLRQSLYQEAVKAAGVLTNPEVHSKQELAKAKARFRELYVAELSMVEATEVKERMIALAGLIDPELLNSTPAQDAAYQLSHALRNTMTRGWKVEDIN